MITDDNSEASFLKPTVWNRTGADDKRTKKEHESRNPGWLNPKLVSNPRDDTLTRRSLQDLRTKSQCSQIAGKECLQLLDN
ncbi:hypothetical protein C5167_049015 [Papaver somniferum]|uniref:Uncharacterized protein n=1 Tax=Papaver somniferum TaxID=3469 RepID=A0A4Y7KKZ5_PAPSO|nr:hypothetical protein C5167_049015 [Papaver somniferum]